MDGPGTVEGARARLERLALEAALGVEGVAGAARDAAAAAEPGDRYGVRLSLAARLVPCSPSPTRCATRSRARRAGRA